MIEARSPEALFRICKKLSEKGYIGCLISGGCDRHGRVPLLRFTDVMRRIRKELGLTLAVHVGLVGEEEVEGLAQVEIDVALIDIIGSRETIEQIYHLKARPENYGVSLQLLKEWEIPVAPHIVIGLHYGKLKGEERALEMIARCKPSALILVILTPLPGTRMKNVPPPSIEDVSMILTKSRQSLPDIPILLGCIRPRGLYGANVEKIAIAAGLDGIAFPSEESLRFAERQNLKIKLSGLCCSLAFREIARVW
jgi:hypothetical protein